VSDAAISKKEKVSKQEYFFSKKVGKCLTDYGMIENGDKILVAVSGGIDSLALLKVLEYRRSFVPVKYDLLAVHIDMGYHCIGPDVLEKYFKKEGFKYHIKKVNILKGKSRKAITCFWCSWNRRKALFETADKYGCNKIALGHHKDDVVATILLNLFFNGEISAMAPRQELFNGKITVIRPLAYIEKREIAKYNRNMPFPHPRCKCPNSDTSRRAKVERIVEDLQKTCPNVKTNVFRSIKRVKKDYLL